MSWINVDEKLPKPFIACLILYNGTVYFAAYCNGQWRYSDFPGGYVYYVDYEDLHYITHWMPLPEPPESK